MCKAPLAAAIFAALLSCSLSAVAQSNARVGKLPPQPELLATLDHHLGWGGNFSRGPRIAAYSDSSVIFAKRGEDEVEATYYRAVLNAGETDQVARALRAAYAEMYKDIHLAPGWHDLPYVTLSVGSADQAKTVSVFGFQLSGHFAPPKTDKKKRPDPLPQSIDRAAKMLMYLDPPNAEKWQPEWFEIRLTSSLHEIPQQVQSWPREWPDLKARSTAETRYGRRGEPEYSILLSAATHSRFLEITKDHAYFTINDKTLRAYHWLPVLPGSTVSRRALRER